MNEATRTQREQSDGETLEQTEALFQRWRESRRPGARIPKALWAAAVRMAGLYGVGPTGQHLRVDGEQLKKRIEGTGGAVPADCDPLAFVALPRLASVAPTGTPECVVEFQNARGGTMRVSLSGLGLDRLASLCTAFWGTP